MTIGLKTYQIREFGELANESLRAGKPREWHISAKSSAQAWAKFCRQYCGPLTPNPKNYCIAEVTDK